jgi:hypothetical protein
MRNYLKLFLMSIVLLTFMPLRAYCESYTNTINYDPKQAYSSNIVWKHTLNEIPQGYQINSAAITLRVQVWYWGWNIYEQNIDIMASDTNAFVLPQDRVCELNPSTNPNSNNFYTVSCQLSAKEFEYIANDGEIYFGTNTYGGTYYLDYSTLTVNAALPIQYTLTVNSIGAYGVSILSSTEHGGTTNYSKTISEGANANLEAPLYHGSGAERKRFAGWSGASSSTERSIMFTMDGDKTVTAKYADDPAYIISVYTNPAACGTVTGGGEYSAGDTAIVTAKASAGYVFVNWSEDEEVVSTEKAYAFAVNGDRNLVANFGEMGAVGIPGVLMLLLD